MNKNLESSIVWKVGSIIWLIIPFIGNYPRPYLITEITNNQVVLATMTTTEDQIREAEGTTQYVIINEAPLSKYDGSLINYNTLLVISWTDLVRISEATYRGKKIFFSFYQLNAKDFHAFRNNQKNYYQDSKQQKRLTKIIYTLLHSKEETWIPNYLK